MQKVHIYMNRNDDLIFSGQTLYNNKEVKDLFINVVDKIIEPMAQYKLTFEELKQVIRLQFTSKSKILYLYYSLFPVLDGIHSGSC